MKIEDSAKKAKDEVDAFVADWVENHKKAPDRWPLDAEESILWGGAYVFWVGGERMNQQQANYVNKVIFWAAAMGSVLLLSVGTIALVAAEPQPVANVTVSRIPGATVLFPGGNYPIDVVRVIDGDTIVVRFKVWSDITLEKTLRFADIDTWETRGTNKEKGLQAKKALIDLLCSGEPYMTTYGKTGSFGRTIAVVYVVTPQGEVSVAKELKKLGHEKGE